MTSSPMPASAKTESWELTARTGASERVPSAEIVGTSWLVRLRWVETAILAGLGVSHYVGTGSPATTLVLALCVGVSAASNVVLSRFLQAAPVLRLATVAVLVLDVLLLTAALHASGGAMNPFSVFYIVHVALAAVLLDVRAAWAFALVTCVAFGSLFLSAPNFERPAAHVADEGHAHEGHPQEGHPQEDHAEDHQHEGHAGGTAGAPPDHDMAAHLEGMWLAYALAALLVGYSVATVARALERRERELARLRERTVRGEQLAALGELAASAAHELGTPLATIAVITKELENLPRDPGAWGALASDARILRDEVDRCKAILARMSVRAGELPGEGWVRTTSAELIAALAEELGERTWARVDPRALGEAALPLPRRAVAVAVASLVRNGLDATDAAGRDHPVELEVEAREAGWTIVVRDRGTGVGAEVREELGEPFVTTKKGGMGLGVFLARSLAERLGGTLRVASEAGAGTSVTLALPRGAEAA